MSWDLILHGNELYPYPLSINADDGETWIARDGTVSSLEHAHKLGAADDLYEALSDLCWLRGPDGESPLERFERHGDRFLSETGMLRPGKSQSDAMQGTPSEDERYVAFANWINAFYWRAEAALAKARGEPQQPRDQSVLRGHAETDDETGKRR